MTDVPKDAREQLAALIGRRSLVSRVEVPLWVCDLALRALGRPA